MSETNGVRSSTGDGIADMVVHLGHQIALMLGRRERPCGGARA